MSILSSFLLDLAPIVGTFIQRAAAQADIPPDCVVGIKRLEKSGTIYDGVVLTFDNGYGNAGEVYVDFWAEE